MRRFGVFGDLPTRAVQVGLRLAPWFIEPLLIGWWALLVFVLARAQRRAVCRNLTALLPACSPLRTLLRAYRVFREFACTYVDAVRCEELGGEVDWAIDGLAHFEDLAARREGCILLTAHMGNYDLAAPLFSGKFGRTVHAVRAPERDPRMQEIREAELRMWQERHPGFRVQYNRPGSMLGVELAKILAAGDVVAVQADRVMFDVSAAEIEVPGGWLWTLPRGPLVLAQAVAAPCFPLFIVRAGWRRYRVEVRPALELPQRRRGDDDAALREWSTVLLDMVRRHWSQWFVFEPVFRRSG
jgi:lauroyl/myristoyl acyltransferase